MPKRGDSRKTTGRPAISACAVALLLAAGGAVWLAARALPVESRPLVAAKWTGLGVIYLVQVTDEGPSASPLAGGEAVGSLIKAHTFARNQRVGQESFARICELATRVPVSSLSTGSDPSALGDWLLDRALEAGG